MWPVLYNGGQFLTTIQRTFNTYNQASGNFQPSRLKKKTKGKLIALVGGQW